MDIIQKYDHMVEYFVQKYDHMVESFQMKFSPMFRAIFAGILLLTALLLWVFVIVPIYHIPVN